jgi:glutathione S-transferase
LEEDVMKLYYANTSPYARKVRIVLRERGLTDHVTEILTNPFEENAALGSANPLHKVPTLVTSQNTAIFDSAVICGYLDTIGTAAPLIPVGDDRWVALTAQAMCDGMLDALFNLVMERRRPEAERSTMWQERWQAAILRTADAAEANMRPFEGQLTLAQISLGAALGYADFRTPDIAWRTNRPALRDWFDAFAVRPSMVATDPSL